jgi:hypothetical protein
LEVLPSVVSRQKLFDEKLFWDVISRTEPLRNLPGRGEKLRSDTSNCTIFVHTV